MSATQVAAGTYRRRIGVIAGLGPLAGANFYMRLVTATPAGSDQEHPDVVLLSDPAVPSRLDHLQGSGPSPVPHLQAMARRLEAADCELLVLTSVTTHAYFTDIAAAVTVPMVNGLTATAHALRSAGIVRPALAVTTPARSLGILDAALREAGMEPCYPDPETQDEIQSLVEAVKGGRPLPWLARDLDAALHREWTRGTDAVLVGCTDISPLVPYLRDEVHDVAAILAEAALAEARR
ncbi:amino acid racemase [Streptomyces sp. NPDC051920]|uniref:aspartate/glutamate racemase family protein n=1 Tax=Streptomyces sp. NPDC051920 TaxID=3155523 RepID=UPI00341254F8